MIQLEVIDAILNSLLSGPKNSTKLYDDACKLRPGLSKAAYTPKLKQLEADGIIKVKKINGKEKEISFTDRKEQDYGATHLRYEGFIRTNNEVILELEKISTSAKKIKKKFCTKKAVFEGMLFHLDMAMSCQKNILFDIQSEWIPKSNLYILKRYVTTINNNLRTIYNLLKKIDVGYFNLITSCLIEKIGEEFIPVIQTDERERVFSELEFMRIPLPQDTPIELTSSQKTRQKIDKSALGLPMTLKNLTSSKVL